MQFKEVVGQEELKDKLSQTVKEGRISHAQLFLGKSGYGTLPLAIAYIQYILCENKQEKDSCGKCNSCIKLEKLSHPDLHFSFPVNTNKKVKSKPLSDDFLENWREINQNNPYFNLTDWHQKIDIEQKQSLINVSESQAIIKKLSLKAYESEYKVLLMWKVENMNIQASNKLLKLIEEPTEKTIIILVAEDEDSLLKTIRSRTQLIRVPPIKTEAIRAHLSSLKNVTSVEANFASLLAEGDLNRGIKKIHQSQEEEEFFIYFKDWMRACYEANVGKIYSWVEEISSRTVGREKQKRFLEYTLEVMREGMIRNYATDQLQRFDGEQGNFMKKFAPFVHENNVFQIIEILTEAHQNIARNAYAKILFMDLSMKFANLLRAKKRTFVS